MISSENILQLTQNNINYIVGARLGNVCAALLKTIDNTIVREDEKSIRIKTDNGYLICSYSSVRFRKDKFEMEKQIELKTGVSIRKFIDEAKKIVDGEILNHITQKIVIVKAQPTPKMMELLAKLEAPH